MSKSHWNSRGVNQKLRKEHEFPGGGGQCKRMENSRGVNLKVNLTGNPGGSTSKKINILNRGGVQFISGKAHFFK